MQTISNYQGPVDPSPLIPKLGESYLDHSEFAAIVGLLNQWQYQTAIDSLNKLIEESHESDENHILALRLLGETYIHLNYYPEALSCFERIRELLPGDRQTLTLIPALRKQLELDYRDDLLALRNTDLYYYTRLHQIFSLIDDNDDRMDLELGFDEAIPVDTIALFGHRFEADGSFSETLLKRLDKTLQMANYYPDARIIVSGGAALSPFLEADRMETWLIEHGIAGGRIYKDSIAKDTVGNVIGIAKLMKELDTKICLAITSLSHLGRAWMSLWAQVNVTGNTGLIYAAAPEVPKSVSLPDDERLYMIFTILKSAHLVEYQDFL